MGARSAGGTAAARDHERWGAPISGTSGTLAQAPGRTRVRQRPPTAKGFVFITLEDEEGLVNVIVRPDVYERYYRTMRNSLLLIVEGTIQKQAGILNVLAQGALAIG